MAIQNPDGTPYELTGSRQQYDPDNPEFDLFNTWDQEAIEIGGAPILYYEVKIQSSTIDPLYHSDQGKLWNPKPVCLYGFYDPAPTQHNITVFGPDVVGGDQMFEFNYQYVLQKLGHLPVVGSRFFTPHRKQNWRVEENHVEEYKLWGELRLQVMCVPWQSSLTDNSSKFQNPTTDGITFNSIRPNNKCND